MPKAVTLRDAALQVLEERGPLHYTELIQVILELGLIKTEAKDPAASVNAMIAMDIKRKGARSRFKRVKPGVFALRESVPEGGEGAPEAEGGVDPSLGVLSPNERVRVPLFPPSYEEVRHLLRVWPGMPKRQVTSFQTSLADLRGTPQENVDWTDPETWIAERLEGTDRDYAQAVWKSSGGAVNPRYLYGSWLLSQKYSLIVEDGEGTLTLTEAGQEFLETPQGETEAWLDEQEGVLKLLALIAESGPTRPGGIREEWSEYLGRTSSFGSPSTIRDTMRRRLVNLLSRGLVTRKGTMYSIIESGLAYLDRVGTEDTIPTEEQHDLWKLLSRQEASVRETLHELLLDLDPIVFEHLVKRLLEEMGYQDVRVTSPTGDGGVDVIGEIELGITSVREVVQAKRHSRPVQRKDLDALRGSLHRFQAVRGTLITTARFSKGTKEAAFEVGAAPITLIDGEKLIDLLIEHGIGVGKRSVELLELDADALASLDVEG